MKLLSLIRSIWRMMKCPYKSSVFRSHPFWIQLCYFISISIIGFIALMTLKPKDEANKPRNFDLFFMSVSASTVSSMATVEMEVFSISQLWILISLMFIGGEVFVSMLGLQFLKVNYEKRRKLANHNGNDIIELKLNVVDEWRNKECLKQDVIRYMGFVMLAYLILVVISGSLFISLYLSFVSSAREVLKSKRIPISTFSIFTTVSSFGNCGFIPTNENMAVFRKESALLLLIIPQILAGSTLLPPCLRFMIWALKKLTKKGEFGYILQNPNEISCNHILSGRRSGYLIFTVSGFILLQVVLFCSLEWNSEALKNLDAYQKMVAAVFQSINSRYAGESVVNISDLSAAILVIYIAMMYLPPYTSFFPPKYDEPPRSDEKKESRICALLKNMILSQLSYLVISTIFICITERKSMVEDPLNFSVFNIMFEVISAYGNVGFSTGYSCQRLLKPDSHCKDAWYGFVGRWSDEGKMILTGIMIFGRLKSFNMEGGNAWNLS